MITMSEVFYAFGVLFAACELGQLVFILFVEHRLSRRHIPILRFFVNFINKNLSIKCSRFGIEILLNELRNIYTFQYKSKTKDN